MALWTAIGIAGGTAGNVLGGALTEWGSWRATLLINVPIGVGVAVAAFGVIAPDVRAQSRPRPDIPGAVLVTAGLMSTAYGMGEAAVRGWTAPVTIAALTAGILLLGGFVLVETLWADNPLIPVRLWRIRSVVVGNAMMLLARACLNPMWFFLTLSMQNGLGYGPLQTGLAFLPHTLLAVAVGARLTPWLMDRVDGRILIAGGGLLAAAGFAWQARLDAASGYVDGILGPAMLFSIGAGLLNTLLTAAVTAGVDPADAGAASGLMNTAKQVGAGFGLAILVTLATPDSVEGAGQNVLAGYGHAFAVTAVVMLIAARRRHAASSPAPPGS